MPDQITIRRPDDWHVHVRDGEIMRAVLPYTARQFARAIIMPNLTPPVTDVAATIAYRDRIIAAIPDGVDFTPLMTCYLSDNSDPAEVARGFAQGVFTAAKLYPANATTNSAHGVTNMMAIMPVLEKMQDIGMPLLIHGEVTDSHVDIFDREAVFIDTILVPLTRDLPHLKIILEHITTSQAVAFINDSAPHIGATITPQHLHINRNAIFAGGIRPHAYCLPIAKREEHRLSLRAAAISGSPKYFLGTDSAPHAIGAKEAACGCAGIFNAPFAIESYACVFDEEGALDKLEGFASLHGPAFYGLPVNDDMITLKRAPNQIPEKLDMADTLIIPFHAGQEIAWQITHA